jgi:cell division protein ZapA (FtsZ GTPase activity inhibitor)
MKNAKGLIKTAGVFGVLLCLTHLAHYKKAEADMRRVKKQMHKQEKKVKRALAKAQRDMEALHDNPPVRVPVPPNTGN